MERLVNFQTMVTDLTGMDDLPTHPCWTKPPPPPRAMDAGQNIGQEPSNVFVVGAARKRWKCDQTRARPLGITVKVVRSADE